MISQFLLRHQAEIASTMVMSDMVIIEFKHTVTMDRLMRFYADLITDLRPKRAVITEKRKVRLEF